MNDMPDRGDLLDLDNDIAYLRAALKPFDPADRPPPKSSPHPASAGAVCAHGSREHARSSRARTSLLTAAAAAAAVIVGATAIPVLLGSSGTTTTTQSVATPGKDDPAREVIVAKALAIADANGDGTPASIQWIHTSFDVAAQALKFGSPPNSEMSQLNGIAVVIRGSFETTPNVPGTQDIAPIKGTTISYFFDETSQHVVNFKYSSDVIDLSTFGQVFSY